MNKKDIHQQINRLKQENNYIRITTPAPKYKEIIGTIDWFGIRPDKDYWLFIKPYRVFSEDLTDKSYPTKCFKIKTSNINTIEALEPKDYDLLP